LRQTYCDYEVIVVDDGSTDDTQKLMSDYGGLVRYLYQENQGASAARNLAIARSGGEYIAYLDADDLWSPDKLARQVEYLDANPAIGFVHTDVSVIDEQDLILHFRFNQETDRAVPQGRCVRDILRRSHIQTLTVLERRTAFDKAGSFDLRLPVAQDYLHWILVALAGYEIGYLPEPLGQYRWRAGSLMSSQRRLLNDFIGIYEALLTEQHIEQTHGSEIGEIVKEQLYATQRQLAYVERRECSAAVARRRLLNLIQRWPLRLELYGDLLKTYVIFRHSNQSVNPS
jgi:glycosyltransferase involved in cell wall biosynthesis